MKMKKVKHQFDFDNIPKVHNLINRVAEIIVQDVKQGVAKGKDLSNVPFEKLNPKTIRAKRRSGSSTPKKPLMDTHKMVGRGGGTGGVYVSDKATAMKHSATIKMPKDREEIGIYHNEGSGNLPVREWWGISDRAKKRLDKMVREFMKLLYSINKRR